MANNEYVNRVDFGDETLIDISNTTAEPEDVIEGQTFYTRSGAPAIGTLGDATTTTHGLMSATDKVKLDEVDSKKAPIIIDSKSGNPVVINDGVAGLKLYDMKVSFSPKQAGTGDPSPTNIRPITGWDGINIHKAGKNLVQFNNQQGPSATFYNGYSGWLTNGSWRIPDGSIKYTYSAYIDNRNASASSCAKIWFYGADGTTSAGITEGTQVAAGAEGWSVVSFSNNANLYFAAFGLGLQAGGVATQGMVEVGESRTDYETYSGTTTPISWQSEAGTVYGGTLDALTGVLTVTWIAVTKTFSEIKYNTGDSMKQGNLIIPEPVYVAGETGVQTKHICNLGVWKWSGLSETQPHFYVGHPNSVYKAYVIVPNEMDDNTSVTVASQLKEPRTVQLDPITLSMLIGKNVIWTDVDDMEIAYPIDTKKYVDAGARDVQIDGNSIINNGIANIPYATNTTPGLIMTSGQVSLGTDHKLWINNASDANIKGGTSTTSYLTPSRQDISTFYGLAKAAGANLANETVTFGQYPNSAKVAIQKMLGIYEAPWEIINEITTTEDQTEILISTDSYGETFELEKAICIFEAGPSTTGKRDSFYGQYQFINLTTGYTNGDSFPSLQYPTATSTIASKIEFDTNKSMAPVSIRVVSAVDNGNTQNLTSMVKKNIIRSIVSIRIYQANSNTSLIPAGAKVTLYGKRVPT